MVPGEARSRSPAASQAELFIVPGKVPLYLEGENPDTASETAANVGVEISAGGARSLFVPGAAAVTPAMRERMARADVIFFDGTLFSDDEMIASGTGAEDRPPHGPHADRRRGRLARGARTASAARRIFVHINNTNPILIDGSPERARGRARRLGSRRGRHGDRAKRACEAA